MKPLKIVLYTLTGICFIWVMGVAAATDQEMISFTSSVIQMTASVAGFALFSTLSQRLFPYGGDRCEH